jgi:tetratricopeptide (TPR) repeat protein
MNQNVLRMKKLFSIILSLVLFTAFAQEPEKDANFYKGEGNTAYEAKEYAKAYENYKTAVEMLDADGITDTALVYITGYSAYKSKMYEETIPLMERTIEYGYKKDIPYQILAACLSKIKKNKEVEEVTRQGLEKFPESAKLKKALSKSLVKQGIVYYKEGNSIKKAANESGLNATDTVAFKAEYAKADAEYAKALPFMNEAFELNPKSKSAVKALVNIYTNLDKPEEVEKYKAILEELDK